MKSICLSLLAAIVLTISGCGGSQTYSGPNGEKVTVSKDGKSVVVQSTDGWKGNIEVAAGEKGVVLPDGFPKDVPIYPGAKPTMNGNINESLTVMFETTDSAEEVAKYYEKNLKEQGWNTEGSFKTEQQTSLVNKKEKRHCTLSIVGSGGNTMIQVILREEK